ncbi:MAG TPA: hypothetical protein VM165_14235 [Planctomycetaceae bacterium]|nr:hypothetical protein [Planctomycetaceae bacterium]
MTRNPWRNRRKVSQKFHKRTTGSGLGGGYYERRSDPTEEEIREHCEAIRATWTEVEHLIRAGKIDHEGVRDFAGTTWLPPVCKLPPGRHGAGGGMYGVRISPEAAFSGLVREACLAVGFAADAELTTG